jgi:hypothetical protein
MDRCVVEGARGARLRRGVPVPAPRGGPYGSGSLRRRGLLHRGVTRERGKASRGEGEHLEEFIETLSATFAGGFLLAQPVGRARDGSFSLAQPVGRSCHGPYVLAEPAGRTWDGSFSLAGSVGRACDGSSLLAPPVGRACHGRSSLAEPVGRTSHGTYPLAQPVGRACDGSSLLAQPVGRASLGVFSPAALQSGGAESRSSARKATDSPTAHLRFEALLRSASARSFLQRNSRLPVAPSSC